MVEQAYSVVAVPEPRNQLGGVGRGRLRNGAGELDVPSSSKVRTSAASSHNINRVRTESFALPYLTLRPWSMALRQGAIESVKNDAASSSAS